jgi:hypothetical protein
MVQIGIWRSSSPLKAQTFSTKLDFVDGDGGPLDMTLDTGERRGLVSNG